MSSLLTGFRAAALLVTTTALLAGGAGGGVALAAVSPWQVAAILKVGGETRPFGQPSGWYHDPVSDRVYVADPENDRLLSFSPSGDFLAEFNAGGEIRKPADMIKDGKGIFRVLEYEYAGLVEVDPARRSATRHDLLSKGVPVYPRRISPSNDGFLVLDKKSGSLVFYDGNYRETARIDCPDPGGFRDFVLHGGEILALSGKKIHRYAPTGEHRDATPLAETIEFPVSLACDPGGLVYLLDRHAGKVAVLQPGGQVASTFLGRGENEGELQYPSLIRFDARERLWIVDEGNNRVMVLRK
ncbi:MAG: hypothetical protein AB1568_01035 [Thermodesulfobacteriota bacterium]